jgi:GNAT superfamily N-acetyltransferase
MLIRFAKESDFDALVRIGHDFFEYNPYKKHGSVIDDNYLRHTLHTLMRSHILLVGEVDGEVVGAAGAFVSPVFWNPNDKQGVEAFWWVDPPHRKGNGKKLRQALERVAKGRGVRFWSMISLELSEPEKMHAMYGKAGFEHIENVYLKVL